MGTIQLDRSKLLGLRILSSDAEAAGAANPEHMLLAAKIGAKDQGPAHRVVLAAKIGEKPIT